MFNFIFMLPFILFGVVIIYFIIEYIKNSNSPIVSSRAKITDKERIVRNHFDNNNVNSTSFIIKFITNEGEEKEFNVDKKVYKSLIVGDSGVLSYQRKRFKNFSIDIEEVVDPIPLSQKSIL